MVDVYSLDPARRLYDNQKAIITAIAVLKIEVPNNFRTFPGTIVKAFVKPLGTKSNIIN